MVIYNVLKPCSQTECPQVLAEGKEDPVWKKILGLKLIYKIVISNKMSKKCIGHMRHVRQSNMCQNQQKPQTIETDPPGLFITDTTYSKAIITMSMEVIAELEVLCKGYGNLESNIAD